MWGPTGHGEEFELQWEAMVILKGRVIISDVDNSPSPAIWLAITM